MKTNESTASKHFNRPVGKAKSKYKKTATKLMPPVDAVLIKTKQCPGGYWLLPSSAKPAWSWEVEIMNVAHSRVGKVA